jgi:hypothetical protein
MMVEPASVPTPVASTLFSREVDRFMRIPTVMSSLIFSLEPPEIPCEGADVNSEKRVSRTYRDQDEHSIGNGSKNRDEQTANDTRAI